GGIAQAGTRDGVVHLSPAYVQPIAADDVALAMADYVLGQPVNGVVEIAGPERVRLADLVRRYLMRIQDPRTVEADPRERYFGAVLQEDTLLPGINPRIGALDFDAWLALPKVPR